jgi:hypothetical protein
MHLHFCCCCCHHTSPILIKQQFSLQQQLQSKTASCQFFPVVILRNKRLLCVPSFGASNRHKLFSPLLSTLILMEGFFTRQRDEEKAVQRKGGVEVHYARARGGEREGLLFVFHCTPLPSLPRVMTIGKRM